MTGNRELDRVDGGECACGGGCGCGCDGSCGCGDIPTVASTDERITALEQAQPGLDGRRLASPRV